MTHYISIAKFFLIKRNEQICDVFEGFAVLNNTSVGVGHTNNMLISLTDDFHKEMLMYRIM